jgi:hypothetical protein
MALFLQFENMEMACVSHTPFCRDSFFTPPYEYDVFLEDTVHEIKSDDSRFSYFSLHFSEFSLLPFIFYFLSRLWQNRTEREIRETFPAFFRTDEWKADPSYEHTHTLIIMGWSSESLSACLLISGYRILGQ